MERDHIFSSVKIKKKKKRTRNRTKNIIPGFSSLIQLIKFEMLLRFSFEKVLIKVK